MDALNILKDHEQELESRFGIKRMGVFGSFAKGEERPDSDVDVLVEFKSPIDIFEFIEVKGYLEVMLGRRVDLVTEKALKPLIRERILNEVVYV
jgi:uncharacterized protein